ncbi:hypothetical protein Tchl_1666 [Thauera chlorobenzoica]|uniref:Uncharacterized protein n=1 Tax=Thauera chlorobenzoica TaxID=96773 RepID=A0A1L6FC79_9RHOO|nr:hypothetical protein Tchl_1666 [Thauera chlorobenzoica]
MLLRQNNDNSLCALAGKASSGQRKTATINPLQCSSKS